MNLVTTTFLAEFFQFDLLCVVSLILHRRIVSVLALGAGQGDDLAHQSFLSVKATR